MSRPASPAGWIRLIAAHGLSARMLDGCGIAREDWPELFTWPKRELLGRGLSAAAIEALLDPDPERLDRIEQWMAVTGHELVTIEDDYFPPLLRRIPDPPFGLFVQGRPDALLQPQLAIVGSRNASPSGVDIASEFASGLVQAGFCISSGLALGIDAAAHRGAMSGGGRTVAVTGTGPDRVYPARHRDLAHQIMDNGAVVTSLIPGTGVRPGHFPARNRIISGMSAGVLVVEAGLRSGSLITARMAGEQGREVFAVPGSIRNPLARGCHQLLRQGAKLVEKAGDLVDDVAPLLGELAEELAARLNRSPIEARPPDTAPEAMAAEGRILDAMGYDPVSFDELMDRTDFKAAELSSLLLQMELDGHLSDLGGGRYCRN